MSARSAKLALVNGALKTFRELISVGTGSFAHLARAHCFHAAGDASVAIAMAGSLFFSIDPSAARLRILLYLVCTLAPFALVGPLIGPAIDRMRGGHRLVIITTLLARAALMLLMVAYIDSIWLFPIAFSQLVLAKSYAVAKAATVPSTVTNHAALVEKNSKLAVLSAFAGGIGAIPALVLQYFLGPAATLLYAFGVYLAGMALAWRLPRVAVSPEVTDVADTKAALPLGLKLVASAMSYLRGISGFMFFVLAFAVREGEMAAKEGLGSAMGVAVKMSLGYSLSGEPAWKLGMPMAFWGLGILIGNTFAPKVRQKISEEQMILGALCAVGIAGIGATWVGGLQGATLLALVAGCAPAGAKLAFDSLVQRDSPETNHGALFGRYESLFQVGWVIGALLAVTVMVPLRVGFLVVALASGCTAAFLVIAQGRFRRGEDQIDVIQTLRDRTRVNAG